MSDEQQPQQQPVEKEAVPAGHQVLSENPDHEAITTFSHVNQQTGNQEQVPAAPETEEDTHHDDAGQVIPGHEMGSQVGRAMALADARARAVATTPNLSDSQPGMPVVKATTIQPVQVDGRNKRSDDDAILHSFVNVVDGDHQGRMGAFERVLEYGEDGWPKRALVRTRDEFNELLSVAYDHLRPAGTHGGR